MIDASSCGIVRFDKDGEQLDSIGNFLRADPLIRQPICIAVDHKKTIYLAEHIEACGGADSEEAVTTRIHQLDAGGKPLGYVDVQGKCLQLATDHEGTLYAVLVTFATSATSATSAIRKQPHSTIVRFGGTDQFVATGKYYSRIFDSGEPQTEWHPTPITEMGEPR